MHPGCAKLDFRTLVKASAMFSQARVTATQARTMLSRPYSDNLMHLFRTLRQHYFCYAHNTYKDPIQLMGPYLELLIIGHGRQKLCKQIILGWPTAAAAAR